MTLRDLAISTIIALLVWAVLYIIAPNAGGPVYLIAGGVVSFIYWRFLH